MKQENSGMRYAWNTECIAHLPRTEQHQPSSKFRQAMMAMSLSVYFTHQEGEEKSVEGNLIIPRAERMMKDVKACWDLHNRSRGRLAAGMMLKNCGCKVQQPDERATAACR